MEVIEQFLQSKSKNPAECEDGIFVNDAFVAVVDGATSKSPRLWEGKKSGLVARDLVLSSFKSLSLNATSSEAMQHMDQAIYDWYSQQGVVDLMKQSPVERPSASVVVYSVSRNELWMLGDCQAIVGGRLIQNEKYIDSVSNNARSAFIEAELLAGKTVDELREQDLGREFIQPLLERQNYFQNIKNDVECAYLVLDGFLQKGTKPRIETVNDAQELVLASDGYPELKNTLIESEEALAEVLDNDPLLYKRFKSPKAFMKGSNSYDDRAYIRFKR